MTKALLAVPGDLHLVGIRTAGRHHVAVHVVDAVLEPTGPLDRRPATEVHDALSQGSRTPVPAGPLCHEDVRSSRRRREGSGRPGGTEANDEDIGSVVPPGDLAGIARRYVIRIHHPLIKSKSGRRYRTTPGLG